MVLCVFLGILGLLLIGCPQSGGTAVNNGSESGDDDGKGNGGGGGSGGGGGNNGGNNGNPTTYTITFDSNGGSAVTNITATAGTQVARPIDPTKAGYGFRDWYSAVSGGTAYTWPHTLNANVTMYAHWDIPVSSAADLTTVLASLAANDAAHPIPVKITVDLTGGTDGWTALLTAISGAGKYLDLDLSACTMTGTAGEFDPGTAGTGESYITGLVLPDAAASIKGDPLFLHPPFQHFTELKTLSASGVLSVGQCAFTDCTSLSTVSLPAVTNIGDYAFGNCTSLSSISFPASLAAIGDNPFAGCINLHNISVDPGNPNYTARNGMLLNKAETALLAYPAAENAVTLNSVTSIGDGAFVGTSLSSVSLPAAASIGDGAFSGCTSLTTVSLPAAASIGGAAFDGCTGLTTVSLPAAASIGEKAFSDCAGLTTVSLPKVTNIDTGAFAGCTSLSSVSLPVAASIRNGAFTGCTSLTTVSLPVAASIAGAAFQDCTSLTTVSLPMAASIESVAFSGCTSLSSVSLPAVANINQQAFDRTGGQSLTITLGSATPIVGRGMFSNVSVPKTVTVQVPSGATGYGSSPVDTTTNNWGNAFRGTGWDGFTYNLGGTVNTNITLTIEYAP
jgi:hypothetical protein